MEVVTARLELSDQEEPPNEVQETDIDDIGPVDGPRSISLVGHDGPTETSTDEPEAAPPAYVAPVEKPKSPERVADIVAAQEVKKPVQETQAKTPLPIAQTTTPASPGPRDGPKKISANDSVMASDDHYLTIDKLAARHPESNINVSNPKASQGLTQAVAAERLLAYGPNALKPPKTTPKILVFLKQFLYPLLVLLEASAALSFAAYGVEKVNTDLYAAIALSVVSIGTAAFTYAQEAKASGVLAKFTRLLSAQCVVIREGVEQEMDAAHLVVGDIVKFGVGQKVPADLRILHVQGVKVDNGPLTGESKPISLNANISAPNTVPTESLCLAWKASSCTEGDAVGLVVRTGDKTFIGGIAALTSGSKQLKTTLQLEIEHFVNFIAKLALTMGIITFSIAIGRQKGHNVVKTLITGFLIPIIANNPEGLPATVNSLLAITANRMAKRNVLVKKLDCVETLGCTSLICSDKTGTLTKNQMTVTEAWFDGHSRYEGFPALFKPRIPKAGRSRNISGDGSSRGRSASESGEDNGSLSGASMASSIGRGVPASREASSTNGAPYVTTFELFHRAGTVCNKAFFAPPKGNAGGPMELLGNASDIAIFRFCDSLRKHTEVRSAFPIDFEIPFNSTTKWMLTVSHDLKVADVDNQRQYIVMMKGAPEVILARCSTYLRKGIEHDIDDQFTDEFEEAYEGFGNKGSRVIAVAQRTFSESADVVFTAEEGHENVPTDNLCFLGLFSITDPPRDGVKEAIQTCHSAGIKVFMVTGDHHLTAKAIAKQIGILPENADEATDPYAVILGSNVEALQPNDWAEIAKRPGVVFARTTPVHKLKIVQSNQAQGHVVAVTGDGVNDAPALKNANIGIAMGISGSEVAREAASIVLMDDNFASIVLGIEQGRVIFDNLKKTIAYTLAHMPPEMVVFVMNLFFAFPAPMSTLQIISIDLATDLGPAIALAYEGPESDIMKRRPRNVKIDRLVSRPLLMYSYGMIGPILGIGSLFSYFWVYANHGIHPSLLFLTADNHWSGMSTNPPFCFGGTAGNVTTQTCLDYKQQKEIAFSASTSYYLTVTLAQVFHSYMCKTSRISVFHHNFDNHFLYYGSMIQLLLAILFSYVPGVQTAFSSGDPSYPGWVCLAITGLVIIVFNEYRKKYMRDNPTSRLTRELQW